MKDEHTEKGEHTEQLSAWVHGTVQGVGFRWWVRSHALELGLTGFARNTKDSRVHVIAQGPSAQLHQLVDLLKSGDTPGKVEYVNISYQTCEETFNGFREL